MARSRPTTSSQELAPPHSSPRLGGWQPSGLRFPTLQRFVPPGCDDASRYTMHASYHLRCTSSIFRLRSWAVQDRNKPRSRFVECVTRGSNAAASARPTMEPLSRACLLCVNPLISWLFTHPPPSLARNAPLSITIFHLLGAASVRAERLQPRYSASNPNGAFRGPRGVRLTAKWQLLNCRPTPDGNRPPTGREIPSVGSPWRPSGELPCLSKTSRPSRAPWG